MQLQRPTKQTKQTKPTKPTAAPSLIDVKFETLKMRKEEAEILAHHVDEIMKKAHSKSSPGCLAWMASFFKRAQNSRSASTEFTSSSSSSSGAVSGASSSSPQDSSSVAVNARIFGLAGAKKASDPARMLGEAASVMRARIEQLEQRAAEQRSEAARLVKIGQKQPALRALKKAKQLEASVSANSASLDAVEQQVDLLAQAAVQKTLTSALETTSKTMQKDKKMVARAEKAVDDAVEVRDMAADLNSALGELAHGGSNEIDEDDLEEELEAMLYSVDAAVDVNDSDEFAEEREGLKGVKGLNQKQTKVVRINLPSVPSRKTAKEERGSLLADDSAQAQFASHG